MEDINKEIAGNAMEQHEATVQHEATAQQNATVSDKKNYAFGKTNFILMAVSMLIVIIGFILMSGASSDETAFNEDIFSPMRIKVAPVVCFIGFVSMIYAIVHKTKDDKEEQA